MVRLDKRAIFTSFMLFVLLNMFTQVSFAQTDRSREAGSDRQQRLQEQRQQANDYAKKVGDILEDLLVHVNQLTSPDEKSLSEYKETLIRGKKHLRLLEDSTASDVILAEAWVSYFSRDLKRASLQASKAYTANPENRTAYVSQVILSMLAGRPPRPMVRVELAVSDNFYTIAESQIEYYMPEEVEKLLGKRYDVLKDIFSSTDHQGEYVGAIFWRLPDVTQVLATEELKDMSMEEGAAIEKRRQEALRAQKAIIAAELKAAKQFQNHNLAKDDIAYMGINLNESDFYEEAAAFAEQNNASKFLFNGEPLSDYAEKFVSGLKNSDFNILYEVEEPVFVIFDRENIVRYIGSARGVMPRMFVEKILPESQEEWQEEIAQPSQIDAEDELEQTESFEVKRIVIPAKKQENGDNDAEKGVEEGDEENAPNSKAEKSRELTPEEQDRAHKLLTQAKMYRGSHTKLGASRKLIKVCREIIQKYPDTKYAEEAKKILRSIPEHQRERFGVTDKELE